MNDTLDMEFGDARIPFRFWGKVYPEPMSGCWLWGGSVARNTGYGQVSDWLRPGKPMRVHRAIARAINPNLTSSDYVCHTCDVKTCVNPDHLYVGDAKSNSRDAVARGRLSPWMSSNAMCANGLHSMAGADFDHKGYRRCIHCRSISQARRSKKIYDSKPNCPDCQRDWDGIDSAGRRYCTFCRSRRARSSDPTD